MKRSHIFIVLALVFCLSVSSFGYAAITDELSVVGSAEVTKQPKIIDYVHVSAAEVRSGTSKDKILWKDGSNDYTNQFGYLIAELDFTSTTTKTIDLTLTNLSAARLAYYKLEVTTDDGQVVSSGVSGLKVLPNSDYPDLEGGFNEADQIVGVPDDKLNSTNEYVIQQGGSRNATLNIGSSSGSVVQITAKFYYASPSVADRVKLEGDATIHAAAEKLAATLNNLTSSPKTYNDLVNQMKAANYQGNYVGNVIGASSSDTAFIKSVFGDTLDSVSIGGGESKPCTIMIKKKNVTSNYSGDEFVLYMTADNPSNPQNSTSSSLLGKYIMVSAMVFVKQSDGKWVSYGGIYTGEARVNNYNGGLGSANSFNTETWRAYGAQTFSTVEQNGQTKSYKISDNADIDDCIKAFESRK